MCKILMLKNRQNEPYIAKNDEVTLQKSDLEYLNEIFKNIFPECSLKMQTFLMSQKMALERNPNV